ncbi:MAG: hypothetical protein JXB44_04470 [Calditrichaceae bacterium]|nr:hypothetical protein [Calditrichaceae bacterium]
MEITETAVTAVLAGIGPDSLLESRKALINELEYVILGTEYSIYEEENVILIKKPNGY